MWSWSRKNLQRVGVYAPDAYARADPGGGGGGGGWISLNPRPSLLTLLVKVRLKFRGPGDEVRVDGVASHLTPLTFHFYFI